MTWKKEEENKAMCRFIKNGSSKDKYQYYVCHRSGSFVSRSKQVRKLKVQGSCKIGMKCASFINLKKNSSGFITVRYCPIHTGHTAQLAHLTLRLEERQALARCIADGVAFNDILHNIQKTSSDENASHLRNVSRKDLQNIVRDFNLSRGKWTQHLHMIRRRHQISKFMRGSCHKTGNDSFLVEGSNGENYSVTKADSLPHIENLCPLRCIECSICVHSFTCNCLDGGLHNTICKHIHFVAQTFYRRRVTTSSQVENSQLENVEVEEFVNTGDHQPYRDIETKKTQAILASCGNHLNTNREKQKAEMQECFKVILSHFESGENEEAAVDLLERIKKTKAHVLAMQKCVGDGRDFNVKMSKDPSNVIVEPQRFGSTLMKIGTAASKAIREPTTTK